MSPPTDRLARGRPPGRVGVGYGGIGAGNCRSGGVGGPWLPWWAGLRRLSGAGGCVGVERDGFGPVQPSGLSPARVSRRQPELAAAEGEAVGCGGTAAAEQD